jgi:hypothetical protein
VYSLEGGWECDALDAPRGGVEEDELLVRRRDERYAPVRQQHAAAEVVVVGVGVADAGHVHPCGRKFVRGGVEEEDVRLRFGDEQHAAVGEQHLRRGGVRWYGSGLAATLP